MARLDRAEVLKAIENATRWGAVSCGLERHKEGRWLEREEVLRLIDGLDDKP